MAINTSNQNLIQQFINEAITLYNYTSSKNMVGNPNYDSKYSVKLGKTLDKIVKAIINSQSDMEEFIKLLDSKDLLTAYLAAEYLYPVSPTKCLNIMKKFYDKVDNKIDQFTVRTKLEGISKKEAFFMDTYKKLYKCEDINSLNREKNMWTSNKMSYNKLLTI